MFEKIKKINFSPSLLVKSIFFSLGASYLFYVYNRNLEQGIPTKPDFVVDVNNDGKPDAFYIVKSEGISISPTAQTASYVAFVDGQNLEKTLTGYVRHANVQKIPKTDFFPRITSDLSLLVGDFNGVGGPDIAVVEQVSPDFGVTNAHNFYDVLIPK